MCLLCPIMGTLIVTQAIGVPFKSDATPVAGCNLAEGRRDNMLPATIGMVRCLLARLSNLKCL